MMDQSRMTRVERGMSDSKSSEQFWIGVVEDSVALGWSYNTVPVTSFSRETAEALAERLNMNLLVRGPDYVFSCKQVQ